MTYIHYAPIIITALITSVLLVVMTPVAHFLGLVDIPNYRKNHSGNIPLTGGLAMFMGILFASLITDVVFQNNPMFLTSAAFIVLLGMLDDRFDLSAKGRLFCQFVVSALMVWVADNYVVNLGDIFGFGALHIPTLGYVFTMVCVVGVINAFNMIDGIDGLAGGMSLVVLFSVIVLMYVQGDLSGITAPLVIAAAIVPFLAFNLSIKGFKGNKIFMGDAGSMFIGLAIVWLLVENAGSTDSTFRPITAVWLIGLPLMDMAAIMIRRARKGRSVLQPDKHHLHNIFIRAGFSPFAALLSILLMGVAFCTVAVISEVYLIPEYIMFYAFIATLAVFTGVLLNIWKILRLIRRIGIV
ncbi:UDP-N-acetylglucosamine--undecaprenyl-phosphate N-acetylglucosaminephosphotransferase [Agaribacter flavus]|uniref:Undecaprenyl-phosphate alpha-N-acetylglucosaminyl 1-phosphate transferase n=1 Tax=Agaribacter flavus TaxID=1902781 RepID=A0ABV7FTY2_9ALTE